MTQKPESKKTLSETDIRTKYITPALQKAGWNIATQIREEYDVTKGRISVEGNRSKRTPKMVADYILFYKPNIPIAVIEAKSNKRGISDGMQQALKYAEMLNIPSVYSSNGDGFIEHDKTRTDGNIEQELTLDQFPSPQDLWARYKRYKGITTREQERTITQNYFSDGKGRTPRYYQQVAINATVEAIAKGQKRVLLIMATGTGKTYTAFQIIHRLWKSGNKKRILFLADRNALIDQTRRGDFAPFGKNMTIVQKKQIDKSYEIYLAIYQGLTNYDESTDAYRQFSPNFFDLVIIDECHRGSANEDSAWHQILTYFSSATHLGLTATPKETNVTSSSEYFGAPIYTYSLRQGIEDGFLAPYRVLRVGLNTDLEGYRPERGKTDKDGNIIEDRPYNTKDYDRNLVIDERTKAVAARITEFLKKTDRFSKTIIFCIDIEHAQRMRTAIANLNSDLMAQNSKYVMQITGDNPDGINELDNFTNPEEKYPVIATTSKLMTTGIDAQICKLIVLDSNIASMTEFKQIIGRGTRINEDYGKTFFTIIDFRNVTNLFADPNFDGDPVRVKEIGENDPIEDIADETTADQSLTYQDPVTSQPLSAMDDRDTVTDNPKRYINGVNVTILNERTQYTDANGKPITTDLKYYTRTKVRQQYQTLNDFLGKWGQAEQKQAIIAELDQQGIIYADLKDAINKEMDIFDLICHAAFDQPPLTRAERANNVRKRDYFSKYGSKVRQVLEALLDKYADEGIESIEDMKTLQVPPFNQIGAPMEIVEWFGGKMEYQQALSELETEIYKVA